MTSRRPVLAAVLLALREHRTRLLALARTAASDGDEELVHDSRVALRRLAAVAYLSRGVPSRGDGEALRLAARDLRRRLSAARTTEVCRALLLSRAAPGRASRTRAQRLAKELFPDTGEPLAVDPHALRAVARDAADRLLELRRAESQPEDADRLERRLARRIDRRTRRALARLVRLLPPQAKDLHRVRIAAKHARYALELARPFLADAGPALSQLKEFQETAGDAHDRQELLAAVTGAAPGRPQLVALRSEMEPEAALSAGRARTAGQRLRELLSSRPPRWRGPARTE